MDVHATCRMDLELGRGKNKKKILILTGTMDSAKVAVLVAPEARQGALKALRGFTAAGSRNMTFEAERAEECPVPLLANTYKEQLVHRLQREAGLAMSLNAVDSAHRDERKKTDA